MSISPNRWSRFKVLSLKAIRAVIDRYLLQNLHNEPRSKFGDPEFNKANETLNAVCKDILQNRQFVKRGQAGPVVHKVPMTNEQLQKLYESQQLGEATTTNPTSFYERHGFQPRSQGFPLKVGGAGKGPGISWSRVHLTPWNPGCNKLARFAYLKVAKSRWRRNSTWICF